MKKPIRTYKLRVEQGKAILDNKQLFFDSIEQLTDGDYVVQIKKLHQGRTVRQNAYYRALLTEIATDTGCDVDEVHEYCREKFLDRVGKLHTIRSTTTLDTKEMTHYIDELRQHFLIEYGIQTSTPDMYYIVEYQ